MYSPLVGYTYGILELRSAGLGAWLLCSVAAGRGCPDELGILDGPSPSADCHLSNTVSHLLDCVGMLGHNAVHFSTGIDPHTP